MNKQVFTGSHPLPFSDLVIQNGIAFTAGQVGFDENDSLADNIEDQTRQTLENLRKVLQRGNYQLEDVVKVGVYLTRREDFADFNEVYAEFFKTDRPVRTTIFTQLAREDFLIEIDAIAIK